MGAEGELGCSDVPGWGDGDHDKIGDDTVVSPSRGKTTSYADDGPVEAFHEAGNLRRSTTASGEDILGKHPNSATTPSTEDGTDDHLHHPLPGSEGLRSPTTEVKSKHGVDKGQGKSVAHADIQSLQESAEITGKIALLSRGGCGFLEKVKWVQRRGGVALIVGDNTRGGGLVTMYARGDTSNVTIPSLFTSHTTAHLLSSLIPPGSIVNDLSLAESGKAGQGDDSTSLKGKSRKKGGSKSRAFQNRPAYAPALSKATPTATARPTIVPAKHPLSTDLDDVSRSGDSPGWLHSVLAMLGFGGHSPQSRLPEDSRRPPTSGHLDWVPIDVWKATTAAKSFSESDIGKAGSDGAKSAKLRTHTSSDQISRDDFIIGVQDWRDPDLLSLKSATSSPKSTALNSKETTISSTATTAHTDLSERPKEGNGALEGGSITPGSGEYGKPLDQNTEHGTSSSSDAIKAVENKKDNLQPQHESGRWFDHLSWGGNDIDEVAAVPPSTTPAYKGAKHVVEDLYRDDGDDDEGEDHEGLWVTLTPTTMSASPFFDTLLVLVVSPLVTLTVVYALLLLRSRIQRRRWRAPKSVVDRLPVRTYHTMTCSSNISTPQLPTPNSSLPSTPSPATSPQSISPHSRPRSRTTSEVRAEVTSSLDKATMKASLLQHEKYGGLRQPRTRYTGKQVECVVCLEEYVDGQSRVMSLPCGHEFHAECM